MSFQGRNANNLGDFPWFPQEEIQREYWKDQEPMGTWPEKGPRPSDL